MTISQTIVVDAVSVDKDAGKVVLTISDHLEWEDDEHLYLLQEKINSYLAFIESGEIYEKYPGAKGRGIVISLICKYNPSSIGVGFLSQVSEIILGAGFDFRYEVFDSRKDS
ncbi:DUF6572 domain-containing protein [Hahella sp. HN01]|uniref:DUF6572 domain-containing protein n=1 Tax=Hahella sp. HN01 TaxID=2847262 RepID=UPI001C1EFC34|nr:DUF6572 domain-containing protein [Hahella sp. HN01]MBU6951605.1 hypothetical protein [Hahella sp. HN01]